MYYYRNVEFPNNIAIIKYTVLLHQAYVTCWLYFVFDLLTSKDFYIMWIYNVLALSVPVEGYFRNAR